jgi:hypothetical protein
VTRRRECDLHSNLLAKIIEHFTVKVPCIVDCDVSRDTVAVDNILLEEFSNCCRAYIVERLCLYPLCDVFDCHDGEGVIALHWG